jgi:predicted nucleic acid-binding protein
MLLRATVDASVFVSAVRPREARALESRELLSLLRARAVPLIEPALMPVEVSAALSRGTGDASLARRSAEALVSLPHLSLAPLDTTTWRDAAEMAAVHSLRGSDAIYVATALRYAATLITLDSEQLERAPEGVEACTPAEALKRLGA